MTPLLGAYVHSPFWPRQRLAVLTSASGVDSSKTALGRLGTKDVGQAGLHVSAFDPAIVRDPGVINHGNLLVIIGPDSDAWVGPIIMLQEDDDTGLIEIAAQSYESILDNRVTPQSLKYTEPIGSNTVSANNLDEANARNHTGMQRAAIEEVGPSIEDLEVGGQSIMESDNELAGRAGYEWWLDYQVTAQHIKIVKRFGFMQGFDLRDRVHYYQGVQFSAAYKADMSQVKASVTTVGDFGADLPDRNSVTHVGSFGPQHLGMGSAARRESTEETSRRIAALPPGQRNEKIVFEIMTGNTAELSSRSGIVQQRPLDAERMINASFNHLANWSDLRVGNIVTLHLMHRGEALAPVVRIMGAQPSWEIGQCQCVCWVVG